MKNKKTCPFMQGHLGCIFCFLCKNFKYFLIAGAVIYSASILGRSSMTAQDKCFYYNMKATYSELKKANPENKKANKARAAQIALTKCNIK
jgi:hypothetical protein